MKKNKKSPQKIFLKKYSSFPSDSRAVSRAGILKLLRSPGIDSKESIPPAFVAWRAGTTTLFLLGS
jgi:hypothetical protein